jgi:hypothetical protein
MDLIYYCCFRMKPPEAERLIDRFEELAEHEIEAILKRYNLCQKILLLRDEQYLMPEASGGLSHSHSKSPARGCPVFVPL